MSAWPEDDAPRGRPGARHHMPLAALRRLRARGIRLVAEDSERLDEMESWPVEPDPTDGMRYCSGCGRYYAAVLAGHVAAWHRGGACLGVTP